MKTKISIFLLLTWFSANASDTKYNETMVKNIEVVYGSGANEEILQAINTFDRIGSAEKNKWEPFYYASFGYVMMATREKEATQKDAYLDQAKIQLDKAFALVPNESEVVAMEGFITMIRLSVDPATRGAKYSAMSSQLFGKALALNPENPRALALMAQMQFGTARFFNASTAEACATTRKALEKFEASKPASPVSPMWGKGMAEGLLKQCQ